MSNIAEIKNCLPVAKFVQNYSYFKGMKFLFVHRYSWLNAINLTFGSYGDYFNENSEIQIAN